jgi:hypothetical protein
MRFSHPAAVLPSAASGNVTFGPEYHLFTLFLTNSFSTHGLYDRKPLRNSHQNFFFRICLSTVSGVICKRGGLYQLPSFKALIPGSYRLPD